MQIYMTIIRMYVFCFQVLESDVLQQLNTNNFAEICLETLVDFCNAQEYKRSFQPNVSVSLWERRSEWEVRARKGGEVYVFPMHTAVEPPPPSPELVTAIADVLHNISAFSKCPVQQWNEQGLYRLLFRCCSWSGEEKSTYQVRAATCRALLAVTSHKCVRTSLATTEDCLHSLLMTLTPFGDDDIDLDCMEARAQGISLLASLLVERTAIDSVWRQLKDNNAVEFCHLLLQCLDSDQLELQDAALYCLTQLAISMTNKKHLEKSKDDSWPQFYDNLKSPFWDGQPNQRVGAGDSARSADCQPEFLAEELCKALINFYLKFSMENTIHQSSQDERWVRVCSCLSSVLAVSSRSRMYGVHRALPRSLLATLHAVRDHLSLLGKPADVIRNANNSPVLRTLYWLLTVIDCSMLECPSAKEIFADENIITSLSRLWPWCMMTEQLRHAVIHLLYTFSNDCPKAWSGACACIGGRTITGEVCALVSREAALQAAARPASTLLLALHTLRRLAPHHHCRAIILKSEALLSMHRLCIRARIRGAGTAGVAWASLCEALARHADGAAALLATRGGPASPANLPPTSRALLLPAIAHSAHHHRQTFLQSPELLELLCDTLLAGDTSEVVSAARAIWALAANNHKAKLVLRSAGASTAVQSTLQRLYRLNRDGDMQLAVELLTYTNTVLQNP